MYQKVSIERKINELCEQEYIYVCLDSTLELDEYCLRSRESKRHKFKIVESFSRLSARNASIKLMKDVPNLPTSEEVISTYISQLQAKLKVKTP